MGLYSYSSCVHFIALVRFAVVNHARIFANFHMCWNKIINPVQQCLLVKASVLFGGILRHVTFQTLATLMYSFNCERSSVSFPRQQILALINPNKSEVFGFQTQSINSLQNRG